MARRKIEFNADTTTLPVVPEDGNFEDATNIIKLEIVKKLGPIIHRADDMANALCLRRSCLPSQFKMDDVIKCWLNLNYDTSRFGQPCWNSLIRAVAEDTGGANKALAMRLAKMYPPGTYSTESTPVIPSMKTPEQEQEILHDPLVIPPVHQDTPLVTIGNPTAESGESYTSSTTTSSSSGSFPTNSTAPFSTNSTGPPTNSTGSFPTDSTGPPTDSTGSFPINNTGPPTNSTGPPTNSTGPFPTVPFPSSDSSVSAVSNDNYPAINIISINDRPLGMGGEGGNREEEGIDAIRSNTAPDDEDQSMISEDGLFSRVMGGVSRHSSSPTSLNSTSSHLPPALQPYPMRRDGFHGYALIINNIDIDRRVKRQGAEHDGAKLSAMFTNLGYKLVDDKVHVNLSAYGIRDIFHKAMNIDHTHCDSFVCCLMSHGDSDHVYGSDDEEVKLDDIRQKVIDCKSLVGKPKIFFIQACRGGELPNARKVQLDDHTAAGNKVILPEACDVFFGYATSPNTKACRFTGDGSWYVIELCRAFQNYPSQDLMTIVQVAHHEVATGKEYVYTRTERGVKRSYRQSPQLVSTLIKKVYFK